MAYLIGADPEVFVTDKNNQFVSAFNMVPGDKAKPYPVPFGAVQVDGMALEFNIEPASTRQEFIHNITCLLYTSPSPRDRTRSRMPSSA